MTAKRAAIFSLSLVLLVVLAASLACSMPSLGKKTPTATTKPTAEKAAGGKATQAPGTSSPKAVSSLEGVQDATVMIEAQGTFIDPEVGLMLNAAGGGSGFIIDPSGIAITNNHVVTGAALLKVWVGGEGDPRNAKILGVSECSDLAVIDIDGEGFPYLDWHTGDVKAGLEIYAAGYPEGEYTLTKGIVSKAQTDGETEWASVDYVLEHDATINPGNSGGPLIDSNGRVVGVNYAAVFGANRYFAIKTSDAQPVIEELRKGKDVDSIGVNGMAVLSEDSTISGIWVSSVKSGSPADKTGIQAGDIITGLESLVLATDGTMSDYCDVLRTHGSDATLSVDVLRFATSELLSGQLNGRELETTLSFAQQYSGRTGESTTGGYPSYVFVTDDLGAIQVEIPAVWQDVDGAPMMEGGVPIGASVWASTDLNSFAESWQTPGVIFDVTADFASWGGYINVLDTKRSDFTSACNLDGRYDYEDILYTGQYDLYANCGGAGGSFYVVLSAAPKDDPWGFLMLVEVQIVTDADWEALDRILNSFEVVGTIPAPAGGAGYTQVTDDYDSIIVEVPASWSDVDGSPWVEDGDVVGASIWAAPDLNGFLNSWQTPGVMFNVSDDLARWAGYIEILDLRRAQFLGPCELDGRYEYEDAYYRGKYDLFKKCGGAGGSRFMVLSAVSKSDQFAYLILVEVQIVTDADWEAVDYILNSFDVIGELP